MNLHHQNLSNTWDLRKKFVKQNGELCVFFFIAPPLFLFCFVVFWFGFGLMSLFSAVDLMTDRWVVCPEL